MTRSLLIYELSDEFFVFLGAFLGDIVTVAFPKHKVFEVLSCIFDEFDRN
jgi:hypothetical protein